MAIIENKTEFINENIKKLEGKSAEEILQSVTGDVTRGVVFSTSFGLEDQALTQIIVQNKFPVEIFTIDTGRLFNETIQLQRRTSDLYKVKIKTYFPQCAALEEYVNTKGQDAFYDSIENRKECCFIRKVEPLKRALAGKEIWLTGIRRAQSPDRANLPLMEYDSDNDIIKVHPLIDWSDERLDAYIKEHKVPYNVLHKKGYVSIGCSPCTRAIIEGEDPRAGRWWWEEGSHKECGLHIAKKGSKA